MSFNQPNDHNVGIMNFLRNKTIFLTGSTGFMGKVFVEKLLRAVPTVQKLYLLVRTNNSEAAKHRVKTEIIDSKLFKVMREKHGKSYEEFMWNKLLPVAGDLCKPNLGMDSDSVGVIRSEVNVIVHMGASTKWNDRHDVSLDVNVRAVSRVVDFATDCMNLVLFLHVSTVFATQNIPGVTFEKSVDLEELGKYCINDAQTLKKSVEQLIDAETRIISQVVQRINEQDRAAEMIKLGIRRSKFYKMSNNYQLTKAMGEMVATRLRGNLPVVIIRPSLVESTFKEPFPGWIEGYKVLDPIILSYGTGELEGFLANPYATLDVVPVDMVVNVMIAAMAKHGNEGKNGVNVYNVASSLTNPLSCHDMFNFSGDYFTTHPPKDSNGNVIIVKEMKFFESINEFILIGLGAGVTSNANLHNKFVRLAAIYEPIMIPAAWYDDRNTRKLLEEMSLEELEMFNFNFKCINWKDYFVNIHIPGLTRHVLKKKVLSAKL